MNIKSQKFLDLLARFTLVFVFAGLAGYIGSAANGRVAFGLFWIVGGLVYMFTKPEKKRAEFEYPPEPPVLNKPDDKKTFGGE